MVMSGCKIEPGSDAGVVRLSIAGIDKYLAIANDCNNRFCNLIPTRCSNRLCGMYAESGLFGAKALAVTDNLNFGNPNKPEAYYMLRSASKDSQMHVLSMFLWLAAMSAYAMSMVRERLIQPGGFDGGID